MPRPPRQTHAGAIHHVLNRCNHQAHLFSSDDLQDCRALLIETKQRYGIQLFAYAFLHNHYHLLLQEPVENAMSAAMHWFNGSVAIRYNLRHKLNGHLWQGRFKSRLVQGERDFLQCMVYVDLNPARAGLASNVLNWSFASTRSHADGIHDPMLDPAPFPVPMYKDLLFHEWQRTSQLHQALQTHDRTALTQWLRNAPSREWIPYQREIALIMGHNFRRMLPASQRMYKSA